jgi:hypothetical protein
VALAILYTFAQNSKTITNTGSGGSSGNGTANFSGWHATNGNGAPYPYYGIFSAAGDAIAIPNTSYNSSGTGAFVHSWEIGFWLQGAGNNTVQKIYDKAWGGFAIQIQSGYLMFIRATAASGSYVYWQAPTTPLTAGHTYYIEVSVNLPANPQSCTAGNVSMRIGTDLGAPVQQAQNAPVKYNAATSWYNDSGAAALGNCSAGCTGYNCNCAVMIYREFNGEAKNWAAYSDWSADVVRWNPAVATTVSSNPSTTTPNTGAAYTVTGTLQTTSGTKLAGKSIDVWYSTNSEGTWSVARGFTTTDSNGNYSYIQHGVASPGEYEYVAFEGDAGHNASSSSAWHAVGQKTPTSITMSPSSTTPPIGTPFTLSGVLSAMGVGLASTGVRLWTGPSQSGPWAPSGGALAATTDGSGNYSISITTVSGATWYGVSYDGDATHLACSGSPTAVAITGATVDQTVNALSPPDMEMATLPLGIEGDWMASPPVVPAMLAQAGPNPIIQLGFTVTPPVVPAMEIKTVIVYPDVEHIWEWCFPRVVTAKTCSYRGDMHFKALPLHVSQLSTQVNTEVVGDCVVETENYTSIKESEIVTTNVVPAMEMATIAPYAKIEFQEIQYLTAISQGEFPVLCPVKGVWPPPTETIEVTATSVGEFPVLCPVKGVWPPPPTETIELTSIVTDEVDLEMEVVTE